MKFFRLTSVTRWVLVVFGCAVLATAQPMNSSAAPTAAPTSTPPPAIASVPATTSTPTPAAASTPASGSTATSTSSATNASNQIIYPQGSSAAANNAVTKNEDGRGYFLVVAVLLAGVGAWIMLQRRKGVPLLNRESRKLQIEETRPLGNRQYLVVASYEDRKFLLGVTAGQIQLLSDLKKPEANP